MRFFHTFLLFFIAHSINYYTLCVRRIIRRTYITKTKTTLYKLPRRTLFFLLPNSLPFRDQLSSLQNCLCAKQWGLHWLAALFSSLMLIFCDRKWIFNYFIVISFLFTSFAMREKTRAAVGRWDKVRWNLHLYCIYTCTYIRW